MSKTVYEHIAFLRKKINPFERQMLEALDAIEGELRKMEQKQEGFPVVGFHEEPVSGVCTRHQYKDSGDPK